MAENTKIEWADHTFNPWLGCTRVSEGCTNCYAEALTARFGNVGWGPKADRMLTGDDNWKAPERWNRRAFAEGKRYWVFSGSMCDVFDDHPSIKQEWRNRFWDLISRTPNLDWLLLTKRPERWMSPFMIPSGEAKLGYRHVWLGCTIENGDVARHRFSCLAWAALHGWRTFVSYEPALQGIDFSPILEAGVCEWIIAGGETGPGARDSNPDWFRVVREECQNYRVPFFMKQMARKAPIPEDLQIREWPADARAHATA